MWDKIIAKKSLIYALKEGEGKECQQHFDGTVDAFMI